jgi:hypothetical protein
MVSALGFIIKDFRVNLILFFQNIILSYLSTVVSFMDMRIVKISEYPIPILSSGSTRFRQTKTATLIISEESLSRVGK